MLATTVLLLVGPHAAARTRSGGWQFTLAPHAVRARKKLDPRGWIWSSVVASTGQPADLT